MSSNLGAFSIPADELKLSFARSSGPGGQNVNKVNSKAILTWDIGQNLSLEAGIIQRFRNRYHNFINQNDKVVIASEKYRDQQRNVKDCFDKLTKMLVSVEKPPKPRRPTKPSQRAKEKRLRQKRERKERKERRQKPGFD